MTLTRSPRLAAVAAGREGFRAREDEKTDCSPVVGDPPRSGAWIGRMHAIGHNRMYRRAEGEPDSGRQTFSRG